MAIWDTGASGPIFSINNSFPRVHWVIPVNEHHVVVLRRARWSSALYLESLEVGEDGTFTSKGSTLLASPTDDDQQAGNWEKVDDSHYIIITKQQVDSIWRIRARVLKVDQSTWAPSIVGTLFEIANDNDGAVRRADAIHRIDATHYVFFWSQNLGSQQQHARLAVLDTNNWSFSWGGSLFSYSNSSDSHADAMLVSTLYIDSTHWVVQYPDDSLYDFRVRVMQANLSTGELSWAGSLPSEVSGWGRYSFRGVQKIDSSHFICASSYYYNQGENSVRFSVWEINQGTWSLTRKSYQSCQPPGSAHYNQAQIGSLGDGRHFLIATHYYSGSEWNRLWTVQVNKSNWSVSMPANYIDHHNDAHRPALAILSTVGSDAYAVMSYRYPESSESQQRIRRFCVTGPTTDRKYLSFFAHAAGTQYKLLNTDTKAALTALQELLAGIEHIAYGNYSILPADIKAVGIAYKSLKAEVAEIVEKYTEFCNLLSDTKAGKVFRESFGFDIGGAYLRFGYLLSAVGARWAVDSDIPFIRYDHFPADGQVAVNPNTTIIMKIVDRTHGVNLSTYWCKVGGVKYKYGDPEIRVYPVQPPNEYLFAVKPGFLGWNKTVSVDAYCEDLSGNPGLLREIL